MQLTLQQFAKDRTQAVVARYFGVSREAVRKMLEGNREIYVKINDNGEFVEAWERRPIPAPRANPTRQHAAA